MVRVGPTNISISLLRVAHDLREIRDRFAVVPLSQFDVSVLLATTEIGSAALEVGFDII